MYHLSWHEGVNQERYQKNAQNCQMTHRNLADSIVSDKQVEKENTTADSHDVAQRTRINGKSDQTAYDCGL